MTDLSVELSKELLLGNVLRSTRHNVPDKVAFTFEGENTTYTELENRALEIAAWLQQKGIQKDRKVAFIFKNSKEFVEIFWGITLSGGVAVPLNFRLTKDEIIYILNDSDSEILFIGEEYIEPIQEIRQELPKIQTVVAATTNQIDGIIPYSEIFNQELFYRQQLQSDNDTCIIMYTSGTTGKPKGAVLTHKNIVMNAQNMNRELHLDPSIRQLIVAPLFHIAALGAMVFTTLARGTCYIQKDFIPTAVLQSIHEDRLTSLFLVPAMWNFITLVPTIEEYDLTSVSICISGAETCPLEIKNRIIHYFSIEGIYECFGQTETSPVTILMQPKDSMVKTEALGKPIVNVEIRVVDKDMNDVEIGKVGEVVYRGPTVMKEYYNKPKETAEAFEGGWFHSGDLVSVDNEGFVYIHDRKKDIIISAGENIYPAEVEGVLYRHEAILEAAVIGVPDASWGESVKAFIVLKEGQTLLEEDVIAFCKESLASYKKPKYVEFIAALPRNTSGKILKRTLREQPTTSSNIQKNT